MTNKKIIWKFQFPESSNAIIDMPENAEILDIQVQNERPVIWALVDPLAPKVQRNFVIFLTEEDIEINRYNYTYLKTLQFMKAIDGTHGIRGWCPSIVIHIFEKYNLEPKSDNHDKED